MAELLLLEFNAPGVVGDISESLPGHRGRSRRYRFPTGMLSHIGGVDADGHHLVVNEVWNSKKDQESFSTNRLGPALGDAGVGIRPVEWFSVISNNQLG